MQFTCRCLAIFQVVCYSALCVMGIRQTRHIHLFLILDTENQAACSFFFKKTSLQIALTSENPCTYITEELRKQVLIVRWLCS